MGYAFSHRRWGLLFAVAVAVATPAIAEVDHDVLTVRTEVRPQCRIQAGDLDLGVYTAKQASRATSSIDLQCTPGVIARIGLNGGMSGDPMNRVMRAKGQLRYQLYKDPGFTQVFADRNLSQMRIVVTTGLPQRVLVYGEAPADQHEPEGSYVDVVTVTITY
jgi:spore coat protein U-like protein